MVTKTKLIRNVKIAFGNLLLQCCVLAHKQCCLMLPLPQIPSSSTTILKKRLLIFFLSYKLLQILLLHQAPSFTASFTLKIVIIWQEQKSSRVSVFEHQSSRLPAISFSYERCVKLDVQMCYRSPMFSLLIKCHSHPTRAGQIQCVFVVLLIALPTRLQLG